MNLWMKRAIGVAALGGGLLAFSAGAASAQETSAEVSARIGRSTSAQARVCSNGQVLSRLVGSCGQDGSSGSVQAGRGSDQTGIRARVRVPRVASADLSLGARRTRPQVTASGQATRTPRAVTARADAAADTSPQVRARATADLSGRLLTVDSLASLAGVGLLGSGPFTLAGDPATDSLLPSALDLDLLTGSEPSPAGIGVLGSGPIASGNQVDAQVGDISPTVPVTVCGNSVGVLGDASASCGANQPPTSTGTTGGSGASAGTGTSTSGSLLDGSASGNQVDAGIGSISPSVPVTVCGNGVGVLGDAAASCGANQQGTTGSTGSTGASGGSTGSGSTGSGNQADATVAGVSPSVPVTACGNSVGLLGDAAASCGASQNQDTSTDGTTAPSPGPTGRTDTTGITGTPGPTGITGITGTSGLTPASSGGPAGSITAFAPLRPLVSAGARALPFTGGASDLLAAVAVALLAAGALFLRAARPAVVREGGDR